MRTQLKGLRDLIIESIKNEEYNVVSSEIGNNHFRLKIEMDTLFFDFSIPMDKRYLAQHDNSVRLDDGNCLELASILFDRHFEPVKKQEIQRKITELQKQL